MSELSVDVNRGCWEEDPMALLSGHWVGSSWGTTLPRVPAWPRGEGCVWNASVPARHDKHRLDRVFRAPG